MGGWGVIGSHRFLFLGETPVSTTTETEAPRVMTVEELEEPAANEPSYLPPPETDVPF